MAARPIYLGTVKNFGITIVNADGSALKTLVTGANPATKITSIAVATDETVARDVQLVLNVGGTDYTIGTVNIPIGAGNTGTVPSIDLLASGMLPWIRVDSDGAKYLLVENGNVLKVKALATLTAAKTIYFTAQGGNF